VTKPQPTQERGSQAAFSHFFTHRAMVRAYLQAMLRDGDLVDDTLSDTAVEVARCWDSYDRSLPFGPWVRGMARRLAMTQQGAERLRDLSLPAVAAKKS